MPPTRSLQIVHGALTFGGSSSAYLIDGREPIQLDQDAERATLAFTVVAFGASEAAAQAAWSALEALPATPFQTTTVTQGGNTVLSWSHSSNTGMNARVTVGKPGTAGLDAALSRRYRVSIAVDLPADSATYGGRRVYRSSTTLEETDARRRRVRISGAYTATSGSSAFANYTANADAFAAAQLAIVASGGTFEGPLDVSVSEDEQNKTLQFSRTYEELIYAQSLSATDSLILRRQRLDVDLVAIAPGDSPVGPLTPTRLVTVAVNYTAAVDKTQSDPIDLVSVYEGTVRPWLLANAQRYGGLAVAALTNESRKLDPVENMISAQLTVTGPSQGTSLLTATLVTTDEEVSPALIVPVWDGDPLSADVLTGVGSLTRTITLSTLEIAPSAGRAAAGAGSPAGASDPLGLFAIPQQGQRGGFGVSFDAAGGGDVPAAGVGQAAGEVSPKAEPAQSPAGRQLSRVYLGGSESETPIRMGLASGGQITLLQRESTQRFRYVVRPSSRPSRQATGGAGGGLAGGSAGTSAPVNPGTQSR